MVKKETSMIIAHVSDFHLGKEMDHKDLLPRQKEILIHGVLPMLSSIRPDVLTITGDIFESVYPDDLCLSVYSEFLDKASSVCSNVIVVSGNHDNPAFIEYLSKFLVKSNIYTFGKNRTYLPRITIEDEYGPVDFYVLPFLQSRFVSNFHYPLYHDEASLIVTRLIENSKIDFTRRNILLGHQYVYSREEKETKGQAYGPRSDMIDSKILEVFDHCCFGHIHEAKSIGDKIVYSGAPYPMHYSDKNEKFMEVIHFGKGKRCRWEFLPIPTEALRIVVYSSTVKNLHELPLNDKDFVYVALEKEDVPIEIVKELQLRYSHFCRCLSKKADMYPSTSELIFRQAGVEDCDLSRVEKLIGKEELTRDDGVFVQMLLRKQIIKEKKDNAFRETDVPLFSQTNKRLDD